MVQQTIGLGRPYWIYIIPTHDMNQWLLLQFLVLLIFGAESVRNMQSDLAVTNKQYCQSCILLVLYIIYIYIQLLCHRDRLPYATDQKYSLFTLGIIKNINGLSKRMYSLLGSEPVVYTGRFITLSVITNIYNKKTKGLTFMVLLKATEKLKKFFFDNQRCSMCGPRVTRHTSIRYSSCCHTRVNMLKLLPHTRQHVDACVATT